MTRITHLGRKLGLGAAVIAVAGALSVVPAMAAQSNRGPINSGTVHANFVSTSDDGNGPGPLALRGAISAYCLDNQGSSIDHVSCPTGTFVIDHSQQGGKQNFTENPSTCVGVFTFSGAPFTIRNGTGAFRGISGTGTAHGTGVEVAPRLRDGSCNPDPNAAPVNGFTEIEATFKASFS